MRPVYFALALLLIPSVFGFVGIFLAKTSFVTGETVPVYCALSRADTNEPIPDKNMLLQYSEDNVTFTTVGSCETNTDGVCLVTTSFSDPGTYTLRCYFPGDENYESAYADAVIEVFARPSGGGGGGLPPAPEENVELNVPVMAPTLPPKAEVPWWLWLLILLVIAYLVYRSRR